MEEEFRAFLLGTASVTNICGTRIDFGEYPQGQDSPLIVLNTISDTNGHDLKGPDGLQTGRVQVDCYGSTYGAAKLLSRAVKAALDGYLGGNFSGVFHEGTRDAHEGGTNENDSPFRVSMDFLTNWRS